MVSTFTANVQLEKPANGDYVNTWSTPVNADWDIVDTCIGGVTTLNATGASGTTALTVAQYRARLIKITGTLTANVTYQIPSGVGGFWTIQNSTTGAFTVTISSGGAGTSVTVTQGVITPVASDGTNIVVNQLTNFASSNAPTFTSGVTVSTGGIAVTAGSIQLANTRSVFFKNAANTANVAFTMQVDDNFVVYNAAGTSTFSFSQVSSPVVTYGAGSNNQVVLDANASNIYFKTNGTEVLRLLSTGSLTSLNTVVDAVGYKGLPQNAKTANYTLALTDFGKEIYLTGTTASQAVTIPANASVAFPIGAFVVITNDSTQPWTIPITSDTLLWSPSGGTGTRTLASSGTCTITKKTATRWWITGTGLT